MNIEIFKKAENLQQDIKAVSNTMRLISSSDIKEHDVYFTNRRYEKHSIFIKKTHGIFNSRF